MKRIVIGVCTALVALALAASAASAAFPGRNGAVLYGKWSEQVPSAESAGSQSFSLEVQAHDGRTTMLAGCDECQSWFDAAFSPDGRLVALAADGGVELITLTGTRRRLVSFGMHIPDQPVFSPGGARLAFTAAAGIWIGDIHDGNVRRVTANGFAPTWSTRNWIAFVRDSAIHRVRPDGSGLRLLARTADLPSWSPDGTQLAFSRPSRRHGLVRRHGIYTMNADGSHVRRLRGRGAQGEVLDLAWSPDGRRLLVSRDAGLVAVDLQGEVRRRFALTGGDMVTPMGVDWQPLPRRR